MPHKPAKRTNAGPEDADKEDGKQDVKELTKQIEKLTREKQALEDENRRLLRLVDELKAAQKPSPPPPRPHPQAAQNYNPAVRDQNCYSTSAPKLSLHTSQKGCGCAHCRVYEDVDDDDDYDDGNGVDDE